MIRNNIKKLRREFIPHRIDGYIIPKNDNFFSEYVFYDRLKYLTNFSGSAGLAIILRKKNFLFVDGRYTIQAKKESGNLFKIVEIHKKLPRDVIKNLTLGFDPELFTKNQINHLFGKTVRLKSIDKNLIDKILKFKKISNKSYYSIPENVAGESFKSKIFKLSKIIKNKKSDHLFISAPENVAWLLNIRGSDVPFSPIPNCNLLITKNRKIFLITNKKKASNLIKEKKILKNNIIEPEKFKNLLKTLKGKKIIIDHKTCSIKKENMFLKKFNISDKIDPCYFLKSIKNKSEIKNMEEVHIKDGVALTKFLYWIKNSRKKNLTEIDAEKKLEAFRKMNSNYLYPSFNTIAGSGPNGAIVHYRANLKSNRIIKKKDIFLCDSGGQYLYGTTDVTRTICFQRQTKSIKKYFTMVLKGHISVVLSNLNKYKNGKSLDYLARKYLKKIGVNYLHGTGHGVGFFSNVHEGPQSISKYSKINLHEGMILSNEPGYYKENFYGIRIENLIYVKKVKKKLTFRNLTMAPIDRDLIDFTLLSKKEKDYLFDYHLLVYSKISKFLNSTEKKWLIKNL